MNPFINATFSIFLNPRVSIFNYIMCFLDE